MHELELARVIDADRQREAAAAVRVRRLLGGVDDSQPLVAGTSASGGVTGAMASSVLAPTARTTTGPSRS